MLNFSHKFSNFRNHTSLNWDVIQSVLKLPTQLCFATSVGHSIYKMQSPHFWAKHLNFSAKFSVEKNALCNTWKKNHFLLHNIHNKLFNVFHAEYAKKIHKRSLIIYATRIRNWKQWDAQLKWFSRAFDAEYVWKIYSVALDLLTDFSRLKASN